MALSDPLSTRSAGVLCHLTSLPGPHGSGDLGAEAHAMVEWLASAKQRVWQVLPVVPPEGNGSPYQSTSAFAGSPLLIDLRTLRDEGLLDEADLEPTSELSAREVRHEAVAQFREARLRKAFEAFRADRPSGERLLAYASQERAWLDDYALYAALKHVHGNKGWHEWPASLRRRQRSALVAAEREHVVEVRFHQFCQYQFARQWAKLRQAARARGVAIFGDLPIFVGHDSADVWARPHEYFLDDEGMPAVIAGCPPDAFSATGQRWGNPLYRWDVHAATGYAWWTARLARMFALFDIVRIDHFIGLYRYWEIPAHEPTAVVGRFVPGPRDAFFAHLARALGRAPIVAEDLGIVTPEVTALRERWGLPGMRVLQFSFALDPSAKHTHPHTIDERSVVYTGTHDNDTSVGWFDDLSARAPTEPDAGRELAVVMSWLGAQGRHDFAEAMRREAYRSRARTAIVPVQDLLGLGREARMNTPSLKDGNWAYRLPEGALTAELARTLAWQAEVFDRA